MASHWLYRAKVKLVKAVTGRTLDDFDWKKYNWHYRTELGQSKGKESAVIGIGDYCLKEDRLRRVRDIAPLHANHRLLYETILLLQPESVCEAGCGGGDHLHNLSVLMPGLRLVGVDRSEEQIAFAKSRHPTLAAKLVSMNLSDASLLAGLPVSDVVFTQAVLMHIKDPYVYRGALRALFQVAGRQVVIIENWEDHDYLEDIRELIAAGGIGWGDTHFYTRASDEGDEARLMIVSKTVLPFPELDQYTQLRMNPKHEPARAAGKS